jgi:hypothetical protein
MAIAARPDFLELPATDTGPIMVFYAQAFGWAMTAFGPSYACTMTGDVDVAVQADPAERAAAPLICLRVGDAEAAVAAVQGAGGTITKPLFAFPGGRRFHFRDPAGNELAAYQPNG